MSLVERSEDFLHALASCKREAKSSFGNDDVLIERYVIQPRHIEVQVLAIHMATMYICLNATVLYNADTKSVRRSPCSTNAKREARCNAPSCN